MRYLISFIILLINWQASYAILTIEITGGKEASQPIAIVPFGQQADKPVPPPERPY